MQSGGSILSKVTIKLVFRCGSLSPNFQNGLRRRDSPAMAMRQLPDDLAQQHPRFEVHTAGRTEPDSLVNSRG